MVTAHIVGVKSKTGAEAEGWFIGCPLTPNQLLTFPPEVVYAKLQRCAEMAEGLGAKIIGLGALTSVVGDGGITLASRVNIAVTTGNSYTVATAVEGAKKGAAEMGICISEATVAVVGAAGSIGHTCALMLAPQAKKIVLVGQSPREAQTGRRRSSGARRNAVEVTGDIATGLKDADVIVTVTSAADAVILPEMLKKGAVVVDVARPRDVSVRVAKERNDVLVIEGGLIQIPGQMRLPKTTSAGVEKTRRGRVQLRVFRRGRPTPVCPRRCSSLSTVATRTSRSARKSRFSRPKKCFDSRRSTASRWAGSVASRKK